MIFHSWEYIAFIAVVLPVYWSLSRRPQNLFLIAASYFFYGWWDWRFLSLILISTVVDYVVAQRIADAANQTTKRQWLLVSLCTNLGILGFFKYFNFFAGSFGELAGLFGWEPGFVTLNLVLPVGISFYTFQTLAYTIDVYRGRQEATREFSIFALYVCYFPQLVAGPIERAHRLLPAFQRKRVVTLQDVYKACQLLLVGFVQKVAIADAVAPYVDRVFTDPASASSPMLVLGVTLFAFQIYGDFAGYSNIARGTSQLLGVKLVVNFRQPYLAVNITDFWRRWHISLSSWLKDYLYISLGGNRGGRYRTSLNLFATMALGGLWHGASWNFVIWGFLHGAFLTIHKLWVAKGPRSLVDRQSHIATLLAWALTFAAVCVAWVFFRAPTLDGAIGFLSGIVDPTRLGFDSDVSTLAIVTIFYGALICSMDRNMYRAGRETLLGQDTPTWMRSAVYAGLVCLIVLVGENSVQTFIYFQF